MPLEKVRNRLDQTRGKQHPGLGRVDAEIVENRLELSGHELRRELVDRGHADRVLRRERDERRHPVTTAGSERLQVGLNPGATPGIGGGNRQTPWYQFTPFAGITRIRFAGLISALVGTPVHQS